MTPEEARTELMEVYRDQNRYLVRADRYYRAEPNSVNLGSRIPPALARFRTPWPAVRIMTTAYADRVALEDVTVDNDDEDWFDPFLLSLQGALNTTILESLAVGIGYLRLVILDNGEVKYTSVRGRDGAFLEDPDTSQVTAVMRVHRPRRRRGTITAPEAFTIYTPGRVTKYESKQGQSRVTTQEVPEGVLLMRPLVNRSRAGEPYGRAEGRDLYSLQDQGSRTLTDLSIATDGLAVPQRVLLATLPESIEDLSILKSYTDSILALSGDVKVDQWQAAQLGPFVETMNGIGRVASSISGLPMPYWGLGSESQGPSGDASRENDQRVEIRATAIGVQFTEPVRDTVRDTGLILGESVDTIVPKWKNPATPTPNSAADAAIKLAGIGLINGEIVIDRDVIWDILRVSPEDRTRMIEAQENGLVDDMINEPEPEVPGETT